MDSSEKKHPGQIAVQDSKVNCSITLRRLALPGNRWFDDNIGTLRASTGNMTVEPEETAADANGR